jgi:hypothetical protein
VGTKLLRGEGTATAGGGGEREILGVFFHGQHHPVCAELPDGLLQTVGKASTGHSGGKQDFGTMEGGGIWLRQEEGHPLPGKQSLHPGQDGDKGVGWLLQIQKNAAKAPEGTLPEQFRGEQTGIATGKFGAVAHRHDAAPQILGPLQAKQTQRGGDAVGQMDGTAGVVPQLGKLGGGCEDIEDVLCHGEPPI